MIKSKLKTLIVATAMLFGAGSAQAVPVEPLSRDGRLGEHRRHRVHPADHWLRQSAIAMRFFTANPQAFGQVAIGGIIFGRQR